MEIIKLRSNIKNTKMIVFKQVYTKNYLIFCILYFVYYFSIFKFYEEENISLKD